MRSPSLRFRHASIQLEQLPERGHGFVATGLLKRGELLFEEQPFVWDSGTTEDPDLQAGAAWLLTSGLAQELDSDADVARYAFRTSQPCRDGSYPAMLFKTCCRLNHSCFPNAGGHLPGAEDFEDLSQFSPCLRIYALEEIRPGEEVCISYLSESDQLSPLTHRQSRLKASWGFLCRCDRCLGGRPLDRRLEAMEVSDRKSAAAAVNKDFCSLFDSSFDGYDPPKDFESTLERLNNFRKDFAFLDTAHVFSQRVRRELIAAFLLTRFESEIARQCAGPALSLLVEEMQVQHALLPSLSPCKVTAYMQFLELLNHVTEREAQWHISDLKVDGCELHHQQSLWLHDQSTAQRLRLSQPRNLPSPPVLGAPLRTGPSVKPGAASGCGVALFLERRNSSHCRRNAWPKSACRARVSEGSEMPPLLERPKDQKAPPPLAESSLWDAYAEFGRPSKDAQSLRGAGKVREKGKDSWFKFRVAR